MNTRITRSALVAVAGLAVASWAVGQPAGQQPKEPEVLYSQGGVDVGKVSADAPKLILEKAEHDFGRISDEKPVTVEIKFTNGGKTKLMFTQQPKASCGCTAGQLAKMEYEPGEGGVVTVTFNPQGKHGDQNQRLTLSTNDPLSPDSVVAIHAFVKQIVSFEPPLVSFGEVRAGQVAKQVLKVTGPAPDFKVTYASNTRGRIFDIKVVGTKEVDVAGEKMMESDLEITFNGKAPRGTHQAMGTARTTLASHSLADFQIMAEVVGDLQVLPTRVNLGVVEAGGTFTRTFRVNSRTSSPFKITDIKQSSNLPEPLEIKVTPAEEGKEGAFQIELKGKSGANPMPVNGQITLMTNSEADPKLEIPFNGMIRPAGAATPSAPMGPGGPKIDVLTPEESKGTPAAPASSPDKPK